MLSPQENAELRTRLQSELTRLTGKAHDAVGFTMDRDRDRIGRDSIDESAEEELYSTQLRLADRENFLITKIQDALSRVDAGTADECADCGEPIGYKRLLARPVTTQCVDCKTQSEQTEADEPVQ